MNDMPLTILIHAHADDPYGLLVASALEARGHRVARHFSGDLGVSDSLALSFGNHPESGAGSAWLQSGSEKLDLDQVDVVWNRHPRFPRRAGHAEAAGGEHARAQLRMAQEAMCVLTDGAFWVNQPQAARRSALKPLQLRMAPAAGLSIPTSLVSNSPEAIRAFAHRHGHIVCKPLHGRQLKSLSIAGNGANASVPTMPITADSLPDDETLRTIPAIYQAYRPSSQRVRAQLFGDTSFAIRVAPTASTANRDAHGSDPFDAVEESSMPIVLPRAIHRSCKILMDSLKLVSCAFDFMLGPDGEWTFLELRESAPFLFMEARCPELPILDAFCAFLESRDADFLYRQPQQPSRLAAIEREGAAGADRGKGRTPLLAADALPRAVAF